LVDREGSRKDAGFATSIGSAADGAKAKFDLSVFSCSTRIASLAGRATLKRRQPKKISKNFSCGRWVDEIAGTIPD
jgi:hypothetical protein